MMARVLEYTPSPSPSPKGRGENLGWAMRHLAAWVFLLAPFAARAEQELPVYPAVVNTRIGNDFVIAGQYHRLGYFKTKDSLHTVARFFAEKWTREGIPVMLDGDFVNEGVVSAFYTREGLQRAVVVRTYHGATLGFTVLKDLW